jgi:hypothetical protein
MVVLADAGGCLTVTAAPTADKLKDLAAYALPSVIPGAPAPARWTPKVARIKAHKSGIVAAASVVGVDESTVMLVAMPACRAAPFAWVLHDLHSATTSITC